MQALICGGSSVEGHDWNAVIAVTGPPVEKAVVLSLCAYPRRSWFAALLFMCSDDCRRTYAPTNVNLIASRPWIAVIEVHEYTKSHRSSCVSVFRLSI